MLELSHHDWVDSLFKLCVIAATGVGSLIGGVGGGRVIIRWFVRRYELAQEQKQRDRDAIATKAASEITRKNAEHDQTLSDLRLQNEKLWKQNDKLWEKVDELQDRLDGVNKTVQAVKHDVGEVQIVAGQNQEKIDSVSNRVVETATNALKKMTEVANDSL